MMLLFVETLVAAAAGKELERVGAAVSIVIVFDWPAVPTLPASSTSRRASAWSPDASVDKVIDLVVPDQVPPERSAAWTTYVPATALELLVSTTWITSPADIAMPLSELVVTVGVVTLVISSLELTPLSLAVASTRVDAERLDGATESYVNVNVVDALTLPARSVWRT